MCPAYITKETVTSEDPALAGEGAYEPMAYARLNSFIAVTSSVAKRRSGLLRGAVVSLGVGLASIALLPLSEKAPVISAETEQLIESVCPWPSPNPRATSTSEVNLYQAELDEATTIRAKARATTPPTADIVSSPGFFFWWSGVGLLVVLVGSVGGPLTMRGEPHGDHQRLSP